MKIGGKALGYALLIAYVDDVLIAILPMKRRRRPFIMLSTRWYQSRSQVTFLKLNMVEVSSFSLVVGSHVAQVILL